MTEEHLGACVVFLLIVILIEVLEASFALCGIGIIPGLFWSQAAFGTGLGRRARAMGV